MALSYTLVTFSLLCTFEAKTAPVRDDKLYQVTVAADGSFTSEEATGMHDEGEHVLDGAFYEDRSGAAGMLEQVRDMATDKEQSGKGAEVTAGTYEEEAQARNGTLQSGAAEAHNEVAQVQDDSVDNQWLVATGNHDEEIQDAAAYGTSDQPTPIVNRSNWGDYLSGKTSVCVCNGLDKSEECDLSCPAIKTLMSRNDANGAYYKYEETEKGPFKETPVWTCVKKKITKTLGTRFMCQVREKYPCVCNGLSDLEPAVANAGRTWLGRRQKAEPVLPGSYTQPSSGQCRALCPPIPSLVGRTVNATWADGHQTKNFQPVQRTGERTYYTHPNGQEMGPFKAPPLWQCQHMYGKPQCVMTGRCNPGLRTSLWTEDCPKTMESVREVATSSGPNPAALPLPSKLQESVKK